MVAAVLVAMQLDAMAALPGGRPAFEKPSITPTVHTIEFRGDAVWLNRRFEFAAEPTVTEPAWPISAPGGLQATPIARPDPASPPPGCVAPAAMPAAADGGEPWRALACDGARWAFARAGYCPEGMMQTGRVWAAGVEIAVPRCHSPTVAAFIGDSVWIGTERPLEKYEAYEGALLEYRFIGDRAGAPVTRFEGEVVTAIAAEPGGGDIWLGTTSGVHRLDLASDAWLHRHFRYRLSPAGEIELVLSATAMGTADYELWAPLLDFPIVDRAAFIAAWRSDPPVLAWNRYGRSPALALHYRDAALAMLERGIADERRERIRFMQLLDLAFGEHGLGPPAHFDVLTRALASSPSAAMRRAMLHRLVALHADADADAALDRRFVAAGLDMTRIETELAVAGLLRLARPDPRDDEFKRLCDRLRADPLARELAEAAAVADERAARTVGQCGRAGEPLVMLPGLASAHVYRSTLQGRALSLEYSELLDPRSLRVMLNGVDVSDRFSPARDYSDWVQLPFVDGVNQVEIRARARVDGVPEQRIAKTIEYGPPRATVTTQVIELTGPEAEAYLERMRAREAQQDDGGN